MSEWISYSERKPEGDAECLISNGSTVCIGHSNYSMWHHEKEFFTAPTHWMPLPELPKKKHVCFGDKYVCHSVHICGSTCDCLVLDDYQDSSRTGSFSRTIIEHCPFCGKKE